MLYVKFESISHYLDKTYLKKNEEKYKDIVKSLYLTRKVTRSGLDFVLDYNTKSKRIYDVLPEVNITDETGITVYLNSQNKLSVQKFSHSYISLDD